MRFSGEFEVSASPQKVWSIVTNPEKFGRAIPDVKTLKVIDSTSFYAEFKVKLGMIGGTIKMNFKFEDMQEPRHVKITGKGSGVQSMVDVKINLDISESNSGSKINWSADLTVGGLVASIGSRLLEGVTKDKVNEIINGVKQIVEKEIGKKK